MISRAATRDRSNAVRAHVPSVKGSSRVPLVCSRLLVTDTDAYSRQRGGAPPTILGNRPQLRYPSCAIPGWAVDAMRFRIGRH